jgi:hypothetical protein
MIWPPADPPGDKTVPGGGSSSGRRCSCWPPTDPPSVAATDADVVQRGLREEESEGIGEEQSEAIGQRRLGFQIVGYQWEDWGRTREGVGDTNVGGGVRGDISGLDASGPQVDAGHLRKWEGLRPMTTGPSGMWPTRH